jgi:hypothetical protein
MSFLEDWQGKTHIAAAAPAFLDLTAPALLIG